MSNKKQTEWTVANAVQKATELCQLGGTLDNEFIRFVIYLVKSCANGLDCRKEVDRILDGIRDALKVEILWSAMPRNPLEHLGVRTSDLYSAMRVSVDLCQSGHGPEIIGVIDKETPYRWLVEHVLGDYGECLTCKDGAPYAIDWDERDVEAVVAWLDGLAAKWVDHATENKLDPDRPLRDVYLSIKRSVRLVHMAKGTFPAWGAARAAQEPKAPGDQLRATIKRFWSGDGGPKDKADASIGYLVKLWEILDGLSMPYGDEPFDPYHLTECSRVALEAAENYVAENFETTPDLEEAI